MRRSCPLCGRNGLKTFTTQSDHVLYGQCQYCRYVSRDPSDRMSALDEKKRYLLHHNRPDDPGYVSWLSNFLKFAMDPVPPRNGRILDFGSGPEPVMAEMLRKRGWSVDIEDVFFAPARRPGPYALITAVEVFEHLADPKSVLKDLAGRLEPNGRLCISTEFLPARRGDFDSWHYRSDATHIGFFTKEGLTAAAEIVGLTEEACDNRRYVSYRLTCPPDAGVLG